MLLGGAKSGQWEIVWKVLGSPSAPKKGYLINVIPENRRWGVLHQSVYWQNKNILYKLLSFKSCDPQTLTKQCTSECGDTSRFTAKDVANSYGHSSMVAVLDTHPGTETRFEEQIPTFQSCSEFDEQHCLGLISITLAAYKNAFHPSPIDPNKSITQVLKDVWDEINSSNTRWSNVRDVVADAVYPVCAENSSKIKHSKTRKQFFVAIINTYTLEENYMYTYLNTAFRRQKKNNYTPTGNDLAIGPYAVVYQMLLLFWQELPRENQTTYRRMIFKKSDLAKYKIGVKFVWSSVVSSSTVMTYAVAFPTCGPSGDIPVVFAIDNRAAGWKQPRNIEKYATYMECERTYPAGASFEVTRIGRHSNDVLISLKLLNT